MGHSAIVIPVPGMDQLVSNFLAKRLPGLMMQGPGATNAHVTVLGPFLQLGQLTDEMLATFAAVIGHQGTFELIFTEQVPSLFDGAAVLVPQPSDELDALRQSVVSTASEFGWDEEVEGRPYRPHLTIDYRPAASAGGNDDLAGALAPHLPLTSAVTSCDLNWWEQGGSRKLEEFPLARR